VDYSRFGMPDFAGIRKRDYGLAVLSGIFLALAFPEPQLAFFAWFAFVPLLLACGQKSAGKAFKLGFIAGLAAYGGILYWINIVMTTYGKLPIVVSFLIFMTLAAYLAIYVGVFLYLVRKGEEKGIPMLLSFPFLWVGLEYLRSFLLTGFPWASLGYSQYEVLPLIQIADVTGVYGLSFLIALSNIVIYQVIRGIVKKEPGFHPARGAVILLALIAGTLIYGFDRLNRVESGKPVKVALVQGNIDQAIKWDPAFQQATIAIYERLTRAAAAGGVDLVVWPESAVPFFFQDDEKYASQVRRLAEEIKSPIIFGSPAYDNVGGVIKYRNSAYLLSSTGRLVGRSDKIHLVPFGEYVPLAKMLPFVHKLVVGIGDFSPGTGTLPLSIGKGEVGVLICFEGIFPELSRNYVRAGSRLLVNVTNDAWYGRSSAPYQHLSMTVFRAVENRVPLVRAANTGISCIIDSKGRVSGRTPLFRETFVTGEVRLGEAGTVYNRYGDVFAVFCLAVSALCALIALFRKKTAKKGKYYV
jgi:apolipoprotein N-acyltransferase